MPTSRSEYTQETDGWTVTAAFSKQVKDKIILVTGTNARGIGGATIEALAAQAPKLLIAAGRDLEKVQKLLQTVRNAHPQVAVRSLRLDLSSQPSCRSAAAEIIADDTIPQLDIIINNAGVMSIPERQMSDRGIEMHLAVNHIGHFLFTNLIMPKLLVAAQNTEPNSVRIVNVASRGTIYSPFRFSDWNFENEEDGLPEEERPNHEALAALHATVKGSYSPIVAYGQSKTANVLFSVGLTHQLHERYGILSLSVHPGVIETELGRYAVEDMKAATDRAKAKGFFFKSLAQGAATQLVAALDPALRPDDTFLSDCQIADWAPTWSVNPATADRLWQLSERLVEQRFKY